MVGFITYSVFYFFPAFTGYWISLRFRSDENRFFPGWYMILPTAGILLIYLSVIQEPILKPLFGAGTLLLAVFFPLKDYTSMRRGKTDVSNLELALGACMLLPVVIYMFFYDFFDSLLVNAYTVSFILCALPVLFYIHIMKDNDEDGE